MPHCAQGQRCALQSETRVHLADIISNQRQCLAGSVQRQSL
jgi:hypothetical protein